MKVLYDERLFESNALLEPMSSSEVIESELDEIAGRLNAEHASLVDVTVRLLTDRSLWADWECGSLEAFISWRTGVSHAVASKVVAVARRVDDLPLRVAAFRSGLLSLDQIGQPRSIRS